jgi:aspartate 1-decarboxylase
MRRLIQELKNRAHLAEKILADLSEVEFSEVTDPVSGKRKKKRNRRLICSNLAAAYNKAFPERVIFITWDQFKAAGEKQKSFSVNSSGNK